MYVCMCYVCIYVCMYYVVCMYVCMHVCMYIAAPNLNMGARWIKVVSITPVYPLKAGWVGPRRGLLRFEEEKNLLLLTG
jgi:hypothetical protein